MKIAALFVGRVKCYEKTYAGIMENVFAGHDVDVFFSHNAANTADNLDDFAARYKVKAAQSAIVPVPPHVYNYSDRNGMIYANNGFMWLMFYHLHNGFRIIDNYMAETGTRYDIILYLRADMHFESRVEFPAMPAENRIYIPSLQDWYGLNDQMAFGTPDAMRTYCSVFPNLERYFNTDGVIYHPEKMLQYHLYVNGMNVVRFPMKGHLDDERHYDKMSFCLLMRGGAAGAT